MAPIKYISSADNDEIWHWYNAIGQDTVVEAMMVKYSHGIDGLSLSYEQLYSGDELDVVRNAD